MENISLSVSKKERARSETPENADSAQFLLGSVKASSEAIKTEEASTEKHNKESRKDAEAIMAEAITKIETEVKAETEDETKSIENTESEKEIKSDVGSKVLENELDDSEETSDLEQISTTEALKEVAKQLEKEIEQIYAGSVDAEDFGIDPNQISEEKTVTKKTLSLKSSKQQLSVNAVVTILQESDEVFDQTNDNDTNLKFDTETMASSDSEAPSNNFEPIIAEIPNIMVADLTDQFNMEEIKLELTNATTQLPEVPHTDSPQAHATVVDNTNKKSSFNEFMRKIFKKKKLRNEKIVN